MQEGNRTFLIKQEAKRLGFDFCGVSKAGFLEEEAPRLEEWLKKGMQGKMQYMENHFDKRLDPRLLVPGAKSVISLVLNYSPHAQPLSEGEGNFPSLPIAIGMEKGLKDEARDEPKISKYAWGKDYHFVIKEKLSLLLDFIRKNIGEVSARGFVDSAPVMDKAWAKKSGLGWIGKNSNLLTRNGSFFFLAELVMDLELEYDGEIPDYCGSCTRCMDACPTHAIPEPYVVDGSRCISYFTIELKENIPDEMQGKFDGWVFGCDICQDVCPWNSFSFSHSESNFKPKKEILNFTKKDWEEISEETFNKTFHDSPLMRPGYKGIKRNLDFLKRS